MGRIYCDFVAREFAELFVQLGVLVVLSQNQPQTQHRADSQSRPLFFSTAGWRARNVVLAIMFFVWGMSRIAAADPSERFSLPVIAPSILQWAVAWLFLRRAMATREGNWIDIGVTSVSLLIGGWLVSLAPPVSGWPPVAQLVFGVGTLLTIISLLVLGKSFAIFPALRRLKTHGPYRIVRHPAYGGELTMLLGISLAVRSPAGWVLFVISVAVFLWRIDREERLIAGDAEFVTYREEVRFRLLPYVW